MKYDSRNQSQVIQWVRQQDSQGCVLAVLAMITGKSYAEVKTGFRLRDWNAEGVGLMHDGLAYLAEHGYAAAVKYRHYLPFPQHRDRWPVAPFADVHVCEVITTQPHAVVMLRDGTVLDPNTPERQRLSNYKGVNVIAGVVKLPEMGSGRTTYK